MNQRLRCAAEPCVNESGTTWPVAFRCSVSSPIAVAVVSAASISPGSRKFGRFLASRLTQTPELHERWDLRFTRIEYLPRPDATQPQQFLYETRIGFGLAIRGAGETVGSRDDQEGSRS